MRRTTKLQLKVISSILLLMLIQIGSIYYLMEDDYVNEKLTYLEKDLKEDGLGKSQINKISSTISNISSINTYKTKLSFMGLISFITFGLIIVISFCTQMVEEDIKT